MAGVKEFEPVIPLGRWRDCRCGGKMFLGQNAKRKQRWICPTCGHRIRLRYAIQFRKFRLTGE